MIMIFHKTQLFRLLMALITMSIVGIFLPSLSLAAPVIESISVLTPQPEQGGSLPLKTKPGTNKALSQNIPLNKEWQLSAPSYLTTTIVSTATLTPAGIFSDFMGPIQGWTIAAHGALYLLDSSRTLYQLDPENLTPLAKLPSIIDESGEPVQGYLAASEKYLFLADNTLTQTLVLSRSNFNLITSLDHVGPVAVDPTHNLWIISSDTSFYPDGENAYYKRPGVFVYDLNNLARSPKVVIEPVEAQYGHFPRGLQAVPTTRQLYLQFDYCCGSHGPYRGYGRYNLDTFEAEGGLKPTIGLGNSSIPGVAAETGLVALTNSNTTGPLSDELIIFNRQGEELQRKHLIHARSVVVSADGAWLYVLRPQNLWTLRGDDLSLQSVLPLSEDPSIQMVLSPDNNLLYLMGKGQIIAFKTAELQRLGLPSIAALPEGALRLDRGRYVRADVYPAPTKAGNDTAFIKLTYGELYRTTNGGQSWTYLPASIYPDFKYLGRLSLSPDFAGDQTLVADGPNGFYHSTNAGETWTSWLPRIAFVSDRDGNREIYTMDQDGNDVQRLTFHPAADENPAWSPAWSRVAFQSDRNGNWDIFSMRLDCDFTGPDAEMACDLRQLTHSPTDDLLPAWSPDGRSIAYVSLQDGNPEIYVMDQDGQNPRRLTFNSDGDWRPTWYPDNRHLAFTSDLNGNNDIYQLTVPQAISTPLTSTVEVTPLVTSDADDRDPDVQFGTLFFLSDRAGLFQVYRFEKSDFGTTVPLDQTKFRSMSLNNLTKDNQPVNHPVWAGFSTILFSSDETGASNIYRRSPRGDIMPLTETAAFDGQPAWGPTMWLPDLGSGDGWFKILRDD